MNILNLRALRGPNLWSLHTSIQAVVRCTEEELHIDRMPGFETRLRERFPQIAPFPQDAGMPAVLEMAALGPQALREWGHGVGGDVHGGVLMGAF